MRQCALAEKELRSCTYMEAQGYRAFILKYRVKPAVYPAPQEDLAKAIRFVREHAEELGVDAGNVMTMGFSAGGHLCASEAALYNGIAKPDKICLGYPVISFVRGTSMRAVQKI